MEHAAPASKCLHLCVDGCLCSLPNSLPMDDGQVLSTHPKLKKPSLLYSCTEGWAVDMGRKLKEHLTVARCVGVRPPKMKVVALLIPHRIACSLF